MFIVNHEVDASLCDLCFHVLKALFVDVELSLGADNVTEWQDGNNFRGPGYLHIAPF